MTADRVIINNLERAASSDINLLQQLGSRALDAFMAAQGSKAVSNPSNVTPFIGADIARSLCVDLKVRGDGANGAVVSAGLLMQASGTWPSAANPPYDLGLTYGLQLSSLPLVLPTPAVATWFLIEVRVTDVVTVSGFRDIFDPVTETFVPTNVNKVRECGVEVQTVLGTAVSLPAPSGDPWVPIGYAKTAGGGVPAPFQGETFVDLRQCFLDGQDDRGAASGALDGHVSDWQMQTWTSPETAQALLKVTGHARGRCFGNDYRFEVYPLLDAPEIETDAAWAAPASTLVHLYLCPLNTGLDQANIVPELHVVADPYKLLRGIPIISTVAPRRMSRENSANITLPVKYTNWFGGVVLAGQALHIASFATTAAGTALQYMSQSSGGFAQVGGPTPPVAPFINVGTYGAAGGGTFPLDLRGLVPPDAKSVRLRWVGDATGVAVGEHAFVAIRRVGTTAQLAKFYVLNFNHGGTDDHGGYVDVPTAAIIDTDINLDLEGLVTVNGGVTVSIAMHIDGWSF